ncbi:serine/threonine-protein kinase [Kitasatospora camelliae]|uniref:non-specific serine/threonine protein kinase n=1 Tax=Kitasatospora camelliae TaxID=3156397 RepID=A0AAU8JU52_9ACTN
MTERRGDAAGRLVADRFELVDRLGAGGMGTVWRARDLTLQREVALKEMRELGVDPRDPEHAARTRERVLREARALARVNHPNVVTVYEVVDGHPYPWLVMELVAGSSLQSVLAQGPLGPARTARIGLDVLAALRAAHASGILHRDVKPGNVLIRPDGTAVLTDFGIAALEGSQTLTGTGDLIGSPEYIAPERIRGGGIGPASDLWSLGMLLYTCVEGGNPVRRDSVWEILRAVCDEPVPPPPSAGPLGAVVAALLQQEPERRPDAAELARLLAPVAAGEDADPSAAPTVRSQPGPLAAPAPTVLDRAAAPSSPDVRSTTGSTRTVGGRRWLPAALAALVAAAVATAAFTIPGLPWNGADAGADSRKGRSSDAATSGSGDFGQGAWIAVLAAVPHDTSTADRERKLAEVQDQVPRAVLENGDDWASLEPGYWVIRAPETFTDGYEALEFCARYGTEECFGHYLSENTADRAYACLANPDPDPAACRRPQDSTTSTTPDPAESPAGSASPSQG